MPVYLQDIMPTPLAIAGVEKQSMFVSKICALISGRTSKPPYKEIYGAYLDAQRSITIGSEKLLVYPNVPTVRVYDLFRDPFELKDMAKTKRGKAIASKLFPRLVKLQKNMGDKLELTQYFPEFSTKR